MDEQYMEHYQIVLEGAEKWAEQLLYNQYKGERKLDYGGIIGKAGLVAPKYSIYAFNTLVSIYFNEDSNLYKDNKLFNTIRLLFDYIEGIQRPDGRFDFITVNFHSAPDTAFMTQRLNIAYRIIDKFSGKKFTTLKEKLKTVIEKAASGIVIGGFHTPNHRWVNTSTLIMSYNITGNEKFKEIADKYLAEGTDCNQDGEFSERSTGIYNAVNDNALILIAQEYDRPELLEDVSRNLEMMLTFIEPDGSLYTGNSTRQDQGNKYYPVNYYHLYLYMAYLEDNKRFSTMASKIMEFRNHSSDVQSYSESLYLYMLNPDLKNYKLEETSLPADFEKFYKDSGVVRVRHDDISFTITENSSNFLQFCVGENQLYLKICASFGDSIAQFNVDTIDNKWKRKSKTGPIKNTGQGYQLNYHGYLTYYLPFEDLAEELPWGDMKYDQRGLTEEIYLDINVLIAEVEDGVKLTIRTAGCDRVPFKIEFGILADSIIEGDSFIIRAIPGESIIGKSGELKIRKGDDIIKIGPAFAEHLFTEEMRGSEPQSRNNFTVYFTDFTNLDKEIYIQKG